MLALMLLVRLLLQPTEVSISAPPFFAFALFFLLRHRKGSPFRLNTMGLIRKT